MLDDLDRPASKALVQLVERRRGLVSETFAQSNGAFSFADLEPGSYMIRLDEQHLPTGTLPPWRQEVRPPGAGTDYDAKRVDVPESGGVFDVELHVFTAAFVWGIVNGPSGEPVENAYVRLQSAATTGQPSSLMSEAATDPLGRFEIKDVYPGRFRVQTYPQAAANELHRVMPAPIPHTIEITAGGYYDAGVIELGGGNNTLTGRVVDDEGNPFQGLPVIAYPGAAPEEGFMPFTMAWLLASSVTDADGRFRLEQLPAAKLKLYVAGDYPGTPLGKRQAAFHTPQLDLDLSNSPVNYTTPDQVVPRSRPFRFRGRVQLDPTWAVANGVTYKDLSFRIRLLDPAAPRIVNRPSFVAHMQAIHPDTGEFEWLCETPHPPVVFTFVPRGTNDLVELVVHPEPDRTRNQDVQLPDRNSAPRGN